MNETMEELEVIPATRSPHGYLASFLSDNIAEKDDGSLLVVGCPIARTGWQKYVVKDLPQELAKRLGVDTSNPSASIDLYRPAKEVFHPEFLSSLNGCAITDGHPPNGEFVDPKNFNKYSMGHIQNVRKGTEPMEDGEWPIIADLHISAEPLISKVRNKSAREISLGYDFSIDRDGDKIIQCNMLGNHNAVVPKGRAGDLIRIEDAMPEDLEASVAQPVLDASVSVSTAISAAPVVEVIEAIAYPPIKFPTIPNKEKQPVAEKKKSWLRSLMGKHLIEMARATDADPEKIMDTAEALSEEAAADEVEVPKNTQSNEFKSEDKKAKDGELPEALKEKQIEAKDNNEDGGAMDAQAKDRKRAHDALDRIMDKSKAKDSNVAALKTLLDEFLSEEEKEPEHADDEVDPAELEAILGEGAEDCEECGKAHDGEECPGQEEVESGEEELVGDEEGESPDDEEEDNKSDVEPAADRKRVGDRARAADAANAVLRMLRPVVARTGDKAVQTAFNRALDSVKKSSRVSTGSYGAFAGSARARDKAPRNPQPDRARAGDSKVDAMNKMQEFYNNAHKGGK